jgi:YtcA family
MKSSRESFERTAKARPSWICSVTSVFVLATVGCSGTPTFNILGSYFPSWLVCLGISIGLTFVAHVFITTKKLADQLWPLPIVYLALVCFFSCTLWLTFFD